MSLTLKKILDLNKKAWDNLAETYDDRQKSPISYTFNEFIGYLPEKSRVLDLGCGTGIPYARYMVDNEFKVTGIDLSKEMIILASRNVPEARFLQISMTEIQFKDEFNGACSSFSMLLLSPEMFLEAAKRIHNALISGGFFYLSLNEPPNNSEDPDEDAYVNIMGQDMYSRAYTVEDVSTIFTGLGFTQVSFHREIQCSKEFGEEHVIEFIYQK
jgi:SAM-dependent methyltransferase